MVVPASFDEIGREYLDRKYMVYVRQSPGVAGNHESGLELQYQLKKRGLELGWEEEKIHIVDDDQGTSGGSTFGRDGFKKMLAEVILGNVGAIGCTEVSRLARDSSDFQYLLKACAMTDTLIIDLYRIYRLSDEDTQLLLGIKGMMAELERRFIKTRMYSAKLNKASKGELRLPLPVGLVYDHKGNIILDPDEEIQRSILLVFSVFIERKSATKVVDYFNEENLLFPSREGGNHDGPVVWIRLACHRVLLILKNPQYAGTYVFGRSKTHTTLVPDGFLETQSRAMRVKLENWKVVIFDHHSGYINWTQYLKNNQQLHDNRNDFNKGCHGTVHSGRQTT